LVHFIDGFNGLDAVDVATAAGTAMALPPLKVSGNPWQEAFSDQRAFP
jgi:hypothetical protein